MTSTSVAIGRKAVQSETCQVVRTSRSVSTIIALLEGSVGIAGLRVCCPGTLFDGIGPGIGLGRKKPSHVLLFQAADAVAELSGAFEFEFFGGFAHLLFELLEQFGKLLFVFYARRCSVESFVVQGHGDVVGCD